MASFSREVHKQSEKISSSRNAVRWGGDDAFRRGDDCSWRTLATAVPAMRSASTEHETLSRAVPQRTHRTRTKYPLRFTAVVERGRRVPIRARERTSTVTVVSRMRHNFGDEPPV